MSNQAKILLNFIFSDVISVFAGFKLSKSLLEEAEKQIKNRKIIIWTNTDHKKDFSNENLKLSLKLYDSLLVTLPNSHLSSEVYFNLGEIQYRILNDFDQSLNFFNKALQHNPKKQLKIKIILMVILK